MWGGGWGLGGGVGRVGGEYVCVWEWVDGCVSVCGWVGVSVCACVCVCVCVWVWVCVCVCVDVCGCV